MQRIACALRSPLLATPSLTRWGLAVCKVPCSHVAILGLPRRRWESSLSPSSPAAGVDGEQEEGVADGQLLAGARPSPAARSPRYMRGRADAAPHSRPRFWKGMGEEEEAWMQLGGDERPPGPVGSLGRAGNLPAAYPPKRKNERRRGIKRELQRQRNVRSHPTTAGKATPACIFAVVAVSNTDHIYRLRAEWPRRLQQTDGATSSGWPGRGSRWPLRSARSRRTPLRWQRGSRPG
jgi:hypothetical protein